MGFLGSVLGPVLNALVGVGSAIGVIIVTPYLFALALRAMGVKEVLPVVFGLDEQTCAPLADRVHGFTSLSRWTGIVIPGGAAMWWAAWAVAGLMVALHAFHFWRASVDPKERAELSESLWHWIVGGMLLALYPVAAVLLLDGNEMITRSLANSLVESAGCKGLFGFVNSMSFWEKIGSPISALAAGLGVFFTAGIAVFYNMIFAIREYILILLLILGPLFGCLPVFVRGKAGIAVMYWKEFAAAAFLPSFMGLPLVVLITMFAPVLENPGNLLETFLPYLAGLVAVWPFAGILRTILGLPSGGVGLASAVGAGMIFGAFNLISQGGRGLLGAAAAGMGAGGGGGIGGAPLLPSGGGGGIPAAGGASGTSTAAPPPPLAPLASSLPPFSAGGLGRGRALFPGIFSAAGFPPSFAAAGGGGGFGAFSQAGSEAGLSSLTPGIPGSGGSGSSSAPPSSAGQMLLPSGGGGVEVGKRDRVRALKIALAGAALGGRTMFRMGGGAFAMGVGEAVPEGTQQGAQSGLAAWEALENTVRRSWAAGRKAGEELYRRQKLKRWDRVLSSSEKEEEKPLAGGSR